MSARSQIQHQSAGELMNVRLNAKQIGGHCIELAIAVKSIRPFNGPESVEMITICTEKPASVSCAVVARTPIRITYAARKETSALYADFRAIFLSHRNCQRKKNDSQ